MYMYAILLSLQYMYYFSDYYCTCTVHQTLSFILRYMYMYMDYTLNFIISITIHALCFIFDIGTYIHVHLPYSYIYMYTYTTQLIHVFFYFYNHYTLSFVESNSILVLVRSSSCSVRSFRAFSHFNSA